MGDVKLIDFGARKIPPLRRQISELFWVESRQRSIDAAQTFADLDY
jgi:hypothetical protein